MARTAVIIPLEDLKDKVIAAIKKNPDSDYDEADAAEAVQDAKTSFYATNRSAPAKDIIVEHFSHDCIMNLTGTVEKDLSKVDFDGENTSAFNETDRDDYDRMLGFNILPNGLPYLGCWAGGDWETPVFFIIYWDGQKLRGYIPEEGNPIYISGGKKSAFGNDDEDKEREYIRGLLGDKFPENAANMEVYQLCELLTDAEKIKADIMSRIQIKGASEAEAKKPAETPAPAAPVASEASVLQQILDRLTSIEKRIDNLESSDKARVQKDFLAEQKAIQEHYEQTHRGGLT